MPWLSLRNSDLLHFLFGVGMERSLDNTSASPNAVTVELHVEQHLSCMQVRGTDYVSYTWVSKCMERVLGLSGSARNPSLTYFPAGIADGHYVYALDGNVGKTWVSITHLMHKKTTKPTILGTIECFVATLRKTKGDSRKEIAFDIKLTW